MVTPQLPLSTLGFKTLLLICQLLLSTFAVVCPEKKGILGLPVREVLAYGHMSGEIRAYRTFRKDISLGLGFVGFAGSTLGAASNDSYRRLFLRALLRAEAQDAAARQLGRTPAAAPSPWSSGGGGSSRARARC